MKRRKPSRRPAFLSAYGGVAVSDSDVLVVSALISVFDSFGSALFVPEGGFTLNSRAAGVTRAPHDAAGGKQPVHTLAPIIIAEQDIATAIAAPPRWRSQDGRLLVEEPSLSGLTGC